MGLVDALARLVGREWRREREREVESRRGSEEDDGPRTEERQDELEERLRKLECTVEELRAAPRGNVAVKEATKEEGNEAPSALSARVEQLEHRLEQIGAEQARQAEPRGQEPQSGEGSPSQMNVVVVLLFTLLLAVLWPSVKDLGF